MRIIICLDEKGGYMFNNRRQSMDRVLRQKLLLLLEGQPLWMSEYTKKQFTEEGNYSVDDNYEQNAPSNAFCFIENKGYSLDNCDEIWIFRWMRSYPSDKFFTVDPIEKGFRQELTQVFKGSSHDEIVLQIYKK